jgi:divalent metal cation (Fe/Co/Zn/Cd) transporter
VIVALIVRAAWHILRQTGGVLVDTAPYSAAQLETWVSEVPAVTQVLRARSRGPADAAHIDIDVQVPPQITADHTAAIAQAIRDKLDSKISGIAEVEVHFAPRSGATDYALAARAQADALGLATHEVHVADGPNGKTLEMHVEVPPGETLSAAHDRVSQLEQQVKAALGDVQDVLTHIEPAQTDAQPVSDPRLLTGCAGIEAQAMAHLLQRFPHADWHDPRTQPVSGGYSFAAHVTLPPQISVEAAHRLAEEAELLLRTRMPQLVRVTLHTEPSD